MFGRQTAEIVGKRFESFELDQRRLAVQIVQQAADGSDTLLTKNGLQHGVVKIRDRFVSAIEEVFGELVKLLVGDFELAAFLPMHEEEQADGNLLQHFFVAPVFPQHPPQKREHLFVLRVGHGHFDVEDQHALHFPQFGGEPAG